MGMIAMVGRQSRSADHVAAAATVDHGAMEGGRCRQ